MEFRNELLWVTDENGTTTVPLLASTEKIMTLLAYPLPNQNDKEYDPQKLLTLQENSPSDNILSEVEEEEKHEPTDCDFCDDPKEKEGHLENVSSKLKEEQKKGEPTECDDPKEHCSDNSLEWKFQEPPESEKAEAKVVHGEEFWWCPNHCSYTHHKPTECGGVRPGWKFQEPPESEKANVKVADGKEFWWCPNHCQYTRHKPTECRGDVTTSVEKSPAAEDVAFQSLRRVTDVADTIIAALNDIQRFRQRNYAKSKEGRERLTDLERRHLALEKQQERLLQQRNGIEEDPDEKDGQEDVDDYDDEDEDETVVGEDRWIRLSRSLNSLRILTPVLLSMLLHPRRNDKQLAVGPKKATLAAHNPEKKKKKSKARCWLFGNGVFDIATNHHCKNAYALLQSAYAFFGVNADQVTMESPDVWEKALRDTMQIVLANSGGSPSFLPDWVSAHPFDELSETDRASVGHLTRRLDEQFGLAEDKDPEQHRQYLNCIDRLQKHLTFILKKRFRSARLDVYGSCLSDLSLGRAADVDLSLHIDEFRELRDGFQKGTISASSYERDRKKLVYVVCRRLEDRKHEFANMVPVARARVPVIKGKWLHASNPHTEDGSIDFDICFSNEIAVANSDLIRQYSLVDPCVKQLMLVVKQWAKEHGISSAQDNGLSSYAWMNLVIFYLQCTGLVPNLQDTRLMEEACLVPNSANEWHCVNDLNTCYLKWEEARKVWTLPPDLSRPSQSVTALLYCFFHFYTRDFPSTLCTVSIKRGKECILPKSVFRKCSLFLCIEDPFETYDSHCPHDLGIPAREGGDLKIVLCLQEAEAFLRRELLAAIKDDGRLLTHLWPAPPSNQKEGKGKSQQKDKETAKKESQKKPGKRQGNKKKETKKHIANQLEPQPQDGAGDSRDVPKKSTDTAERTSGEPSQKPRAPSKHKPVVSLWDGAGNLEDQISGKGNIGKQSSDAVERSSGEPAVDRGAVTHKLVASSLQVASHEPMENAQETPKKQRGRKSGGKKNPGSGMGPIQSEIRRSAEKQAAPTVNKGRRRPIRRNRGPKKTTSGANSESIQHKE